LNKYETIRYWVKPSEEDYKALLHLFEKEDYHWSLFIGHLVIEKLLKALFISNNGLNVKIPKIHDLLLLAQKANIEITEDRADLLDTITAFNISARYPDYKKTFYKKCTLEYSKKRIDEINEVRSWLYSLINPMCSR
jgi:HEPN domain-containing protein